MNDLDLIARLQARDKNALSLFYEEFKARVYNTALSLTQNNEDAEEITQDVFLEIFDSAVSFKGQSSVSTWVYRITTNKCIDLIRHRSRKKRITSLFSIFSKTGDTMEVPHFDHPGVLFENKEKARILFAHIHTLPESQKTAFILSQVEGLSQKEVGQILKISEKAVEALIQRAKSNLKKKLKNF